MAKALNEKQRAFCRLYALGKDTLGNGTQAYAEAYGYDLSDPTKYRSAKASAHKLLKQEKVNAYIDELLEDQGVDDRLVDRHMWLLITQNGDLSVKRQAISDYLRYRPLGGSKAKKEDYMLEGTQIALDSLEQYPIDPEEEAQIDEEYDLIEQRWEKIREGKVPYPR
jgi:hypothetical protein